MKAIVINFLHLEILNMNPVIYWGVAGVCFLILASAFMSVRSLSIPIGAKVVWLLVIVGVPVIGLAAYALRCLFRADWDAFKPLFQSRQLDNKVASIIPVSKA